MQHEVGKGTPSPLLVLCCVSEFTFFDDVVVVVVVVFTDTQDIFRTYYLELKNHMQ